MVCMRSIITGNAPKKEKVVYIVAARREAMQRIESVSELRRINPGVAEAELVTKSGSKRHFTRHVNPYLGEPGGFVEQTAIVGESAFVSQESTVEEGAVVTGNARILDSRVYGSALVEGNAIISDSEALDGVRIGGNSVIKRAFVSGDLSYYDAKIEDRRINDVAL